MSNRGVPTIVAEHIVSQLTSQKSTRPLFVALQGPQGIGKTTLTSALQRELTTVHRVRVAVLSLDDFYLPHIGLVEVAEKHLGNDLFSGRGQPGTHDLDLARRTLEGLAGINDDLQSSANPSGKLIKAPLFDKSLLDGKGDRSSNELSIEGPLDIVLFEGWCMGFYPLPESELYELYKTIVSSANPFENEPRPEADIERAMIAPYPVEHILQVNTYLRTYTETLYDFFSTFVQVCNLALLLQMCPLIDVLNSSVPPLYIHTH